MSNLSKELDESVEYSMREARSPLGRNLTPKITYPCVMEVPTPSAFASKTPTSSLSSSPVPNYSCNHFREVFTRST